MTLKRKYFGTDGIRGRFGHAPITPDFALLLAQAVSQVICEGHSTRPRVVIGKDTRISCAPLESALVSGFNAAGVDVLLLGPVPTPAVAYLMRTQRADLGVVISASHNPFEDNGIKFFGPDGSKLPDSWELRVEDRLQAPAQWADIPHLGTTQRMDDAAGRYIEFCKSTCPPRFSLQGLKIVVDAAHGAAYQIAPSVLSELGAEVIKIGCEPTGVNINQNVGVTHPQALMEAVVNHGADYGIALDGDADRVQMADATGRLFNGDELLYLLAADRIARGQTLSGVVGTLMTNCAVELAIKALGVAFVRAPVGDRYVQQTLKERGWALGGEGSGHLLMLDRGHTTGDGIISALQVLQACLQSQKTMAHMLAGLHLMPQVLLNVALPHGLDWATHPAFMQETRAVEQALAHTGGRVLIRASGTEALLRIMVEAPRAEQAQAHAQRLAHVIAPHQHPH